MLLVPCSVVPDVLEDVSCSVVPLFLRFLVMLLVPCSIVPKIRGDASCSLFKEELLTQNFSKCLLV